MSNDIGTAMTGKGKRGYNAEGMHRHEADLQRAAINELCNAGYAVLRVNGIKARTPNGAYVNSYITYPNQLTTGVADLLVMRGNRMCYIELKTVNGEQTPAEHTFQLWCEYHRIPYTICRTAAACLAFADAMIALPERVSRAHQNDTH